MVENKYKWGMYMVVIDRRENELLVSFDYSAERVRKIKTIRPAEWNSVEKIWSLPYSVAMLEVLKRLFCDERVDIAFEKNELNDKVVEEYKTYLRLKAYSHQTQKLYLSHLLRFRSFVDKEFNQVENSDIKRYLLFLTESNNKSKSFIDQAVSVIKLLYKEILPMANIVIDIPRPKKDNSLPNVLSQSEVMKILQSTSNEKHRTILFLIYSAGLRVGEVVRLKAEDIDSSRMLIRVEKGKGSKDRYTLLSQIALEQLRKYYKKYKPEKWLFEGGVQGDHITERTVQKVFESCCEKSRISKDATVHTLRHSFATHLLESGVDLRYIQELLGHASTKTTEIYTHVTQKNISEILSPLDRIVNMKS